MKLELPQNIKPSYEDIAKLEELNFNWFLEFTKRKMHGSRMVEQSEQVTIVEIDLHPRGGMFWHKRTKDVTGVCYYETIEKI